MGQMDYNFNGIEGDAGDLLGAVSRTEGLLEEGKGSIATLTSMWEGDAQQSWFAVQTRWDQTATELNTALKDLSHAISEAGSTMAQTEASVAGTFGA